MGSAAKEITPVVKCVETHNIPEGSVTTDHAHWPLSVGRRSRPRRSSSWPRAKRELTFGTISSPCASWTRQVRRPNPRPSCP
eukprot:8548040-Pyramimonas_sp.AAC.1